MSQGSKKRILATAGFVNISQMEKGPKGFPLCRVCRTETAGRRNTFCSKACVHWHKIRSNPGYARDCVKARDGGVCQMCRLDTDKLKRVAGAVRYKAVGLKNGFIRSDRYIDISRRFHEKWPWLMTKWDLKKNPPQYCPRHDSYWQMDHIIPVSEGGGECGLENLRTLCLGCHTIVTTQLRKRLKHARADKTTGTGDFGSDPDGGRKDD